MLNFLRLPPLLFVLLGAVAHEAFADDLLLAAMDESAFFSDLPVVLTATRLKQPKSEAPIATTIIDRQMIEASGFTEIPDLLRLAPGMLVNYDSGHIPAAGYQFLFNRYTVRMQILVDGRSVYTPIFGEMPWTQLGITIDDIDRIEVIRGPSSSSYGPNAMTGVISIITRHAAADRGISLKLNHGKLGRDEKFVHAGDSIGKLDYRFTLAKREDDGFPQRYDGKDVSIANFRGDYALSSRDNLTFHATYNDGDLQEDNVFDPLLQPGHVKHTKQSSQQIKWTRSLDASSNITVNYYQQHYDDDNAYTGIFPPLFLDDSVTTERHNLEFSHSMYLDAFNVSWGMTLRRDKSTAPQYLYQVSNNTTDTRQVFVNSQIFLSQDNIISLGLLGDDNDTGDKTWSPSVAFNHHFNDNHSLRMSYSKASRSPFIFEEYTNYYVPGAGLVWSDLSDLQPENIESVDMGYLGQLNDQRTEIDLRIFSSRLTDLIVLDNDLGTGGFLQGDAFDIQGFESSIRHRYEDTRLIFNFAAISLDAKHITFGNNSWIETGAPQKNMSALAIQKFGGDITASLGFYYTGNYQQLCCETDQQGVRRRFDLVLTKKSGWTATARNSSWCCRTSPMRKYPHGC